MSRAMRLNVCVMLATLLVGLGLVAGGDNTSWSGGFGYDGRLYGDLAQHFPGAVFGDEGVTPTGYGPFTGERPDGLNDYYARRSLPSAVVYYSLSALSIEKNHDNVVACFGIWNALMTALVALLWCLCADRLRLSRSAKLLGACGLLINFATLKAPFYFPVSTDAFAVGLAALSLYFWLTRRTAALALVTFLNAFTWPPGVVLGVILILFPAGELKLERRPLSLATGRRRATILKLAAAAIPAMALLGYLLYLRATGYRAPMEIPFGAAFVLAVVTAAAFVFGALLFLVPDLGRHQLRQIAGSLLGGRTLLAAGTVAAALVLPAVLAERPGYSEAELLRQSIWYSALKPGLFLIAMIGFFGPMLALAVLEWPRVCRQIHSFGLGATLVAALFVAGCLFTESRKSIALYPFIVLFTVLACRQLAERRWFLAAFAAVSLVASRVWLPIGEFGFQGGTSLRDFPAQHYFMSSGIWTSFEMYLVQLAALPLLLVMFVIFRSPTARDPGPLSAATMAAPRP